MHFTCLLILPVQSRERDNDDPAVEYRLQKQVNLPLPPQIGLWLQDESLIQNVILESVAVSHAQIIAYARPLLAPESRLPELITTLREAGWVRSM
jgi:hypothetical protein